MASYQNVCQSHFITRCLQRLEQINIQVFTGSFRESENNTFEETLRVLLWMGKLVYQGHLLNQVTPDTSHKVIEVIVRVTLRRKPE